MLYCRDFALPVHSSIKPAPKGRPKTEELFVLEENDTEEYDYGVLVLGVTGVGKSTMCNFFFNVGEDEDVFGAVEGMVPGTAKCDAHCHPINGKNIMFIDSPGFADARKDSHEQIQEMGKALLLARNGVHAIVVCLNGAGRFTEAEKSFVDELKQLETDELQSIWAYTFLVFTHGLNMGKNEEKRYEKIEKWKADPKCAPLFLELLDKVQNRFMVLESLMDDTKYYTQKCDEFLKLTQNIYAKNNERRYTHKLFIWARDKYEEAAKKHKQRIDRQTQQQKDAITLQLDMLHKKDEYISQLENEKKELAKKQQEMEDEFHKAEKELKDNEHKIMEYENNIKTMKKEETLKLQDAYQKLERIKQEKTTVEEMVENKQRECDIQKRIIRDKQTAIAKESTEKWQIHQQLQKEKESMEQLKLKTQQLLCDRQVVGEPQTLTDALELMTNEMDKTKEELTATKDERDRANEELSSTRTQITQLTEQIDTKDTEVTRLMQQVEKYSIRGIPIPFTNRKVVLGPRRK